MKRRNFIKVTSGAGAVFCLLTPQSLKALWNGDIPGIKNSFMNPLHSDGPWVVWHWTSANQTREGITSNLEGMSKVGIAGATLFSFPPDGFRTVLEHPAAPLTPEWFDLVNFAVTEAGRLGIDLAIQISAGWATAGGDWIPPELSQQQIVWSERVAEGGKRLSARLVRPQRGGGESRKDSDNELMKEWDDYYRDLSVLAFPVPEDWEETNISRNAKISTNLPVSDLQKLVNPENSESVLNTEQGGYIQFEFSEPFTLRSVTTNPGGYNRPAHSMEIQASEDGNSFRKVGNLEPMMHSWQTRLAVLTHTIPQTKSRFFRFIYHPASPIGYDEHMESGSHRGSARKDAISDKTRKMLEMIDPITITSIQLSSKACVHHWEGKTALVWGRSRRISVDEMPDKACIPLDRIIDLTAQMNADGSIDWQVPEGNWKIMRFGYTTMARTNGSGIGQGLEADKFSREGARIAFEGWYERILQQIGPRLSNEVVKMLNVDSWECGSQNWSPVFRDEFKARRGYDVTKYLPTMAGIPVENADVTEGFLFDVRRTIADLISDNFFEELKRLAHARGSIINTEAVPPGMMSDGILVHKNVDMPSSEFWVTAWQNWKPCDIAEAASGAHIYGKKVVIAEAFTGGGDWKEHPYDLKAMGDMHFVDGINRMMIHLWAAQPFPGRVPGQTGAAGLFFNEHTTWIKPGKIWIDYLRRCQSLLQTGFVVKDALYFIGEEVPCRALIPPKYGSYYVTEPALPEGYSYDSVNQDALLNLAQVEKGMVVFPSGVKYKVLVLRPDRLMTPKLVNKIRDMIVVGAQVVGPKPLGSPSLEKYNSANEEVIAVAEDVWGNMDGKNITEKVYGSGRIFWGMTMEEVMERINVDPDLLFLNQRYAENNEPYEATAYEPYGIDPTLYGPERQGWGLMFNHRSNDGYDYYFLSNQEQMPIATEISIRQQGMVPEFWHPDTGLIEDVPVWKEENGRTIIPYVFDSSGSVFILFRKPATNVDQIVEIIGSSDLDLKVTSSGIEGWASKNGKWTLKYKSGQSIDLNASNIPLPLTINGEWDVSFPLLTGEEKKIKLQTVSWTESNDDNIKYFSGTATYRKRIDIDDERLGEGQKIFLDLGDVKNLATIKVNGKNLGVTWKPPYVVDITNSVREGENEVEIEVTNTWYNRLKRDSSLPVSEKHTWVLGEEIKFDMPLCQAGLLGPVKIIFKTKVT